MKTSLDQSELIILDVDLDGTIIDPTVLEPRCRADVIPTISLWFVLSVENLVDEIEQCEPVYETLPGWSESTAGLTSWEHLPTNARRYLERVRGLIDTPIDMVSTGPDRDHTILLRHPYQA